MFLLVLALILMACVAIPATFVAARNRRRPEDAQSAVNPMQNRIDVETQVDSMGLSGTGYRPEDPLGSQHR